MAENDVVIRPVAAADRAGVVPLAGSPERAAARLRAAERGDDSMLVAVAADGVVGAVSIRWRDGCDPPRPWLYGLHVATGSRRAGIGRGLVRAAEEAAWRHGDDGMSLDVDEDDTAAAAFYRALGYVVAGPHLHHWRSADAEGTARTLIMRRVLGSRVSG